MSLRTIPAGMLIRLRAGQKPLSRWWSADRHTATGEDFLPTALERDPGDYQGKHCVDDARVGSVVVVPFRNAPAQLVQLTRMAVSA